MVYGKLLVCNFCYKEGIVSVAAIANSSSSTTAVCIDFSHKFQNPTGSNQLIRLNFGLYIKRRILVELGDLTIPMMVDESPDNRQQDSAVGESPEAATDGGDKDVNGDDANTVSSSNSSMADGLSSLISSVMTAFDSRAEATARSQDQLTFALDRLTGELDTLLEDAPSPFIMQHAARISGVRKRVKSLNNVLKSIQRRIDNMDRMMSAGLAHGAETMAGESSEQQHAQ